MMGVGQKLVVWVVVGLACLVPIAFAATSPLLAWRDPIYIVAGFAGIFGLILLLLQPLLINALLPGLSLYKSRRVHRWIGVLLVIAIFIHVGGLWLTSPPDVIDALLFVSPTPFSVWGVVAMWAIFASAILAVLRHKQNISIKNWRLAHTVLAMVIVTGTIVHTLLIEGTMETISKVALCILIVLMFVKVVFNLKVWRFLQKR